MVLEQVQTSLIINSDRLNRNINELAEIGKQPLGSVCRFSFSPEDLQAPRSFQD